jgi:alanine dehydrogenase
MDSGCIAIAYETVQLPTGELPLLTPMSEVAGRMSVQEGAKYLEKFFGGRGMLLGGVPGVQPAKVVDPRRRHRRLERGAHGGRPGRERRDPGRLAEPAALPGGRDAGQRDDAVLEPLQHPRADPEADLVVGAVLLPGAKAPNLVRREDLKR